MALESSPQVTIIRAIQRRGPSLSSTRLAGTPNIA
jgi:hypothetical protein